MVTPNFAELLFKKRRTKDSSTKLEKADRHKKRWTKLLFPDTPPSELGKLSPEEIKKLSPASLRASSDPKSFFNSKTRKYIRKGIPNEFRCIVWQMLAGSNERRKKNPNLYAKYLEDNQISPMEKQIRKDVSRTFRSKKDSPELRLTHEESLFRVLRAFALHDAKIGYCQGMNNVGALLLYHMVEEEAFWVLVSLSENPLYDMRGYWRDSLPKLKLRFFQLTRILENEKKTLYKHFKKKGFIDPAMYGGTSYFIDPFLSNNMKKETVFRIWDVYFSEGYKWIFKVVLAFLEHCRKRGILKMDLDEMKKLIQSEYTKMDADFIIKKAGKIFLPERWLNSLEKKFIKRASVTPAFVYN